MWGHSTWNRIFYVGIWWARWNFGNKEAWDYISTFLCGENDWKSCYFFLRGETGPLARLGSFQIRVGQQGSRELLLLLCNNEPNMGDERADNPGHKLIDSGIVPKMERFHGPVEKGYAFLQSFKTMTGGFNDNRKMQILAGLLEGEALSWYLGTSFSSWKELENRFFQTWCVYRSSTTAIVEVAKVYQKEYEHIRVYASKFDELHRFFRCTLTEEAVIGLFLDNVRKSLKVHAIGIKRSKPSWNAFLCEITKLDNEEPWDILLIKGNVRKPVLAVDVERNTSSPRERKLELINVIEMLKKRIREIEVSFEKRKKFRSGYSRNQREQVKKFHVKFLVILQEIVSVNRIGTMWRSNQKEKKILRTSFWEKEPGIRWRRI